MTYGMGLGYYLLKSEIQFRTLIHAKTIGSLFFTSCLELSMHNLRNQSTTEYFKGLPTEIENNQNQNKIASSYTITYIIPTNN